MFYLGVIRQKWNFFNEFTIYVKSLKSINGDKVLNSLINKKENDEYFDVDDLADLETLIFMDSTKTIVELFNEICPLVNEIKTFDMDDMYDLKSFLLMYIEKFVTDEEEAMALKEVIGIRNDLFGRAWASVRRDGYVEGEAKGEAKGEVKTEIRIIKNMLKKGYSIENISQIVGLDEYKVLNLIESF